MRQWVVWFVLGVLIGSLFVVSAYPTGSNVPSGISASGAPQSPSVPQVASKLKNGNFVLVDSHTLETLVEKGVLPYAPIFEGNTVYAIRVLPDGKFFIYAGTDVTNPTKFLKDAEKEFLKINWNRDITLRVEPSNFSWQVMVNGKTAGDYMPEATAKVNAYIESTIEWSSYDNWKPHGKLKLVWEVYKLADTDPRRDYRVVDMKTFVWSGHYLYGDSGSGKWQIDTVKITANVRPDGNNVFNLADFGPSHYVNEYNSKTQSTISYTLGTGGASVTLQQVIKLFKIAVDTDGNWVRWTYTFNRDEKGSYADSWVKLEPGYQFITHVPSSPVTAHQKLIASVEFTYNRPGWLDDHWTGSTTIDWIWDIG
ncbi:hypothetical protein [Thermococcus aciditolerans]|uniref:Uncharacterized protein n=1 Tax=Thermococcus aciditolerans TaxID=2598455 RepID=A0A5C0SJB0_9EURY|nr:hypothetical protein [Thermococcus aciditolerans]QEK14381.1 hypothetical protein FPV09_03835 [Thermococcus aciditolerans]